MDNIKKSFDYFLGTLQEFGVHLLDCTDEDIEYYIFEEFDTDSISFLHENVLNLLLASQFIDKEVFSKSLNLATKFRKLEKSELWNVESVRKSREWRELLMLSDEIKNILN